MVLYTIPSIIGFSSVISGENSYIPTVSPIVILLFGSLKEFIKFYTEFYDFDPYSYIF